MRHLWGRYRSPAWAVLAAVFGAAGCGERLHPVHGKVTLEDGKPLTRGMVVCERREGGATVTARGEIKPDGTYQLGTDRPGGGAPPGRYRTLINPMDFTDVPDEQKNLPYDLKYLRFETSGLEFEVKSGSNEFPIRLERSNKGRR